MLSPVKSSYLSLNLQQRWYNSYTVSLLTQQYLSLSLRFKGHFPGELGLAMFIEAKDDGGGGDNWTTGAIGRAKLQSNHHQQTNIQFFTGRMPFLSQTNSVKALKGKISHSKELLTELIEGSSNFVSDH